MDPILVQTWVHLIFREEETIAGKMYFILLGIIFSFNFGITNAKTPPNIVVIVPDDLGFNDVSWPRTVGNQTWHNKDIIMPNIHELAMDGIRLENHYTQSQCSPSRSALMTGRYPTNTGMQRNLGTWNPLGLPTNIKTMPEYLKTLGYKTHAFGKWHLGYCNEAYLPMRRGFDTFNGYIAGSRDYYTHGTHSYDYRRNYTVDLDAKGIYQADLMAKHSIEIIDNHVLNYENDASLPPFFMYLAFHSVHAPIQVPLKYLEMYNHLSKTKSEKRRKMMAMVTALDDNVGKIVQHLKKRDLFDNTIFLFTSDNGGEPLHGAENKPLRGRKFYLYEGGTKTAAFISGPKILNKSNVTSKELIHITDWLPTFVAIANGTSPEEIDGLNQWPHFTQNKTKIRSEMLYGIGEFTMAAYRINDMKLMITAEFCGTRGWNDSKNNKTQLYDLGTNPSENQKENLAMTKEGREIVEQLKKGLKKYCCLMKPALSGEGSSPFKVEISDAANPKNFGGIISPGWCDAKQEQEIALDSQRC